jgi:hypothetical protein
MVLVLHFVGLLVDFILWFCTIGAKGSHALGYEESSLRSVGLAGETPVRASRFQNRLRTALLVSGIQSRDPVSCRRSIAFRMIIVLLELAGNLSALACQAVQLRSVCVIVLH